MASNALRSTDFMMARSMQRLSTGLRINSASDDDAGLAISSKMSSQIRGLNQAVRNANDAISLVQVTEGASQAVEAMLQRIRELSVQATSDSNTEENRTALRAEVTQLVSEIGRISSSTQWNGSQLLDGSTFAAPAKFQVGSNADQTIDMALANLSNNSNTSAFKVDLSALAADVGRTTSITHGTVDTTIPMDEWFVLASGVDFTADSFSTFSRPVWQTSCTPLLRSQIRRSLRRLQLPAGCLKTLKQWLPAILRRNTCCAIKTQYERKQSKSNFD